MIEMKIRTKINFCLVIWALVLATGASAQAKKETPRTVTEVLSNTVKNLEHDLVPAAEAMPEDKFGFAPSNGEFKGVRTFGEQIKHIAAVNYELAAAILSEKPPVDIGDESGPASVKSKADILKYLNDLCSQGDRHHQRQEPDGHREKSVWRI